MFGLRKKEAFQIAAPADGKLISLGKVPDEVFSQKIMGDGFAVIPENGKVLSPVSGIAESVFPTGHAVGIRTRDGIECIIHVGLDTVNLNGEGFKTLIHQGDKVKARQSIIEFDKELIERKGYDVTVIIVFPSGCDYVFSLEEKKVAAGEKITL